MFLLILILAALGPNLLDAKVVVRRKSHYCIVREERFSYEFDFTELTNDAEDYIMQHDVGSELRIQPCKSLNKLCNGMEGYSICLYKHGKEIGIGKEPPNISIKFGEIIFKYTGDRCDNSQNYTVNIKMICDFAVKDGNRIKLFAAGYDECNFNMDWRTEVACTKRKQINCTIDDKSGHYDLRSLTNPSNNYKVSVNDRYSVILNVCHSVLYGPNACKSNHAACLVDKQSPVSKNLGSPTENLRYNPSDGTLSLKYTDGAICDVPNSNHMQTTIIFICDLNAIGTLPQYAGGMEQCNYNFTWKTASACSEQALYNKSLQEANNDVCAVKNPLTNQIYNLTALMNKEYGVKPFGTTEVYKFSICSSLINTTCLKGSGACKLHKSVSGGIANSKLMWKQSGPYLNYTNGDSCFTNKTRYTIIEFFCGSDDLEIEEKNDLCYDVIKLNTNHVCNKQKGTCATFNSEVSFEQLINQTNNYITKTDDTEYHINVCRSLVPETGLNCTEGAAICKTSIVNGKVTNAINLGYPDESPIRVADQSAVLLYRNGSVCEEDKKRRIESSISFLCDINSEEGYSRSNPQFKKYNNCTYFFEWKTNLVCGKVDGTFNKNCSTTNILGDTRHLSALSENGTPMENIKNSKRDKTYKISLCGDNKVCNGSFICDDKINYGTKVSVLYDYSVNVIHLKFSGGSKCNGSIAQSTLTIFCKEESLSSEPTILWEEPCRVDIEWSTFKICKSRNVLPPTKITPEKSIVASNIPHSLSGGEIAGIVILILIIVIAICYLQNASRRSRFVELISNSTARNCDRVKYSRVNTMEEVHLLLNASDPTVIESDSDDDELLDA